MLAAPAPWPEARPPWAAPWPAPASAASPGPPISGALAQSLGLAVPLLATAAIFAVITAGLAVLRVPPGPAAPYQAHTRGERPAAKRP